jgi:hypothetical protein
MQAYLHTAAIGGGMIAFADRIRTCQAMQEAGCYFIQSCLRGCFARGTTHGILQMGPYSG